MGRWGGRAHAPPRFVTAENVQDYIPWPRDGVWEPAVDLGAEVKSGDLLGYLHDFSDHSSPALEIRAHRPGYVAMMHLTARARKGSTLYVIAQNVLLESLLA